MKENSLFSFTRSLRRQPNVAIIGHREGADMKREWHSDDLIEHWTMLPRDRKLLGNKSGPTRLGFAVLLKYFQYEGRFPQYPREVPSEIVTYIAQQLDLEPEGWSDYD
jgi:hypothetical protein